MRVFLFLTLALPFVAGAAERMTITVSHELEIARPSETITVPWTSVNAALPGARLQQLVVKDAKGQVLPYQVTNVAPQIKDPKNVGAAYGELIFQHDFAKGEKSARFTVEKIEGVAPVFPAKTFGRYVPERLDDFAWENDKLGHRMYGPALAAPAPAGSGKEVLVTSGIDIWFKKVSYPIVDRWYNKGHDHYHVDEGEGMDMYNVGTTRGLGGTGIWDGQRLWTGRNYATWKVLANGPVRTVFEVTYDTWDGGGVAVSETKRISLDAGQQFDRVSSTFAFGRPELTVAVGVNKTPADKHQEAKVDALNDAASGAVLQWVHQKSNGDFGTVIAIPSGATFAEDEKNSLLLAKVKPGQPLQYLMGAAWDRASEYKSMAQWRAAIADVVVRERSPLKVSVDGQ
jgi:pectinesterase